MKKKELWGTILLFTLLRAILVALMGLMPQDAYYSYYADHLALSYFDHPPMVAYMIKAFFTLFGKSALSLHIGDAIVTSLTLYLSYYVLSQLLKGDQLRKAFVLLVTTPFITILCINTTPDVPLLFFWTASIAALLKAMKKLNPWWWLLSGLLAGGAFMSKYTALLLPFGVFIFMLFSKEWRTRLFSINSLLYLFGLFIGTLPVLIWNVQNDFISFAYQSSQRATDIQQFVLRPTLFAGYIGTQMMLGLPILFFGSFYAFFRLTKKLFSPTSLTHQEWLASSLAYPTLLAFTGVALVYWVKINWIMPAYLMMCILVVTQINLKKSIRYQTLFSIIIHIVFIIELIWMPIKVDSDDTWFGWEELSEQVTNLKKTYPDHFVFSNDAYKTTAALNFFQQEHIYAGNVIGNFAYQFGLDNADLSSLRGRNAIYVNSTNSIESSSDIENQLLNYFHSIKRSKHIILHTKEGRQERIFEVIICTDYK